LSSFAVGVGQFDIWSVSPLKQCSPRSPFLATNVPLLSVHSFALGVCQDKRPLSSVRSSNIGRSKSSPFRIEPERGKFSKYGSSCWKSENWRDVFHKDPSGLNFANDSCVLKEQSAAAAVDSGPLSGHAEVLARESPSDSIHKATPGAAVEGGNVRPDRSFMQCAVAHTRRQDRGGRDFPLHETDCAGA
jgi:hypothetical protein